MSRIGATLAVLFVLLARQAGAQSGDVSFSLVVPLRGTPAASVARVGAIVESLGGHLDTAQGEPIMMATWPDGGRLQVVQTVDMTFLDLTCSNAHGGARAMCNDIAQRYQTGREPTSAQPESPR
jgi:hypothetical protein